VRDTRCARLSTNTAARLAEIFAKQRNEIRIFIRRCGDRPSTNAAAEIETNGPDAHGRAVPSVPSKSQFELALRRVKRAVEMVGISVSSVRRHHRAKPARATGYSGIPPKAAGTSPPQKSAPAAAPKEAPKRQ